jgi:hypothetical protein
MLYSAIYDENNEADSRSGSLAKSSLIKGLSRYLMCHVLGPRLNNHCISGASSRCAALYALAVDDTWLPKDARESRRRASTNAVMCMRPADQQCAMTLIVCIYIHRQDSEEARTKRRQRSSNDTCRLCATRTGSIKAQKSKRRQNETGRHIHNLAMRQCVVGCGRVQRCNAGSGGACRVCKSAKMQC